MEPAMFEGFLGNEWDALCKMFTNEDSNLLLQLHGDVLPSNQSIFFPIDEENVGNLENGNPQCFDVLEYLNFHNVSNGIIDDNANMVSSFLDVSGGMDVEDVVICPKEDVSSDKFANVDAEKSRIDYLGTRHLLKRKLDSPEASPAHDAVVGKCISNSADIPAKKPRNTKRNKKRNEEEGNVSSNCSSEDDSKTSMESNGGGLISQGIKFNKKNRANRGCASDPQSLYARRRRERINERLRILQNLIPNGTKVDISTMLEEAVHYVKFLQLQIKILSSNDTWMYAPIAYNGIDLGMYNKIIPNL